MNVLRIILISLIAPVVACAVLSLALYSHIDRASFLPLLLAWPGSMFVLMPGYGALRTYDRSLGWRYGVLIAIGTTVGALMLFIVDGLQNFDALVLGGLYALTTSLCWTAIHAATRRHPETTS